MENPNSWNQVMRAINRFHWDHKTVNDDIINNLINYLNDERLLTSQPSSLHSVVKTALEIHVEDLANHICGHSIGAALYYKLKAIGAVE